MLSLYEHNGLPHFEEREIEYREHLIRLFSARLGDFLKATNQAWVVRRIEAPLLLPLERLNPNYTSEDVFHQQTLKESERPLVLRPETTESTYAYMAHLLDSHAKVRLPLCVWQAGKSFRREQDQPTKHMRLKEFWQLEFQCAYSSDTANDYYSLALPFVRKMLASEIALPTRIVESDRLPDYSEKTFDVEVDNGDKWMEICSISSRRDFPLLANVRTKAGDPVNVRVLEIAIGLDRCVFNKAIADEKA